MLLDVSFFMRGLTLNQVLELREFVGRDPKVLHERVNLPVSLVT